MRILIMGLPGSGKTTLAKELTERLEQHGKSVLWLNADNIRTIFNDWDFTEEGRIRQAVRMRRLANGSEDDFVIADFVAPLEQMRDIYDADFTIWLDTIPFSRFEDTDAMFQIPNKMNVYIHFQDSKLWSKYICNELVEKGYLEKINNSKSLF